MPKANGALVAQAARLERMEIVPVDPLRDRFVMLERLGEITAGKVAKRMDAAGHQGFMRRSSDAARKRGHGEFMQDNTRVKRVLGLKLTPQAKARKDGTRYPSKLARYLRYEYAVTLAEILGMEPVDAGV